MDSSEDKLKKLEERIQYLELVAEKSGMEKKVKLTLAFESLDKDLQQFAKDFIITMNSYFSAYRSLSTGLVQSVKDEGAFDTFKTWSFKILGFVPIIGDYIGIIDDIISSIVDEWKNKISEEKTEKVMEIIKALMVWDEDEVSNAVAWTAIQLCLWYDSRLYGVDAKNAVALILGYLILYGGPYNNFKENIEFPNRSYTGFSLSCINNLWNAKRFGKITLNI